MSEREELRGRLFMEIVHYGRNTRHGTVETFACVDRILALLPPQPLFRAGDFVSSSGETLGWKIECDALSDADWDTLAAIYAEDCPPFGEVIGVERGGVPFANALRRFSTTGDTLVADDVLTTGASITEVMAQTGATRGVAAFDRSRRALPPGVTALFRLMPPQPKLEWREGRSTLFINGIETAATVVERPGMSCWVASLTPLGVPLFIGSEASARTAVERAVKEALGWTR